jgi:hypothetical protein
MPGDYPEFDETDGDRAGASAEPDEAPSTNSTSTHGNIELRRHSLSRALVHPSGAARYVVGAEDHRVEELLDERYVDPYAGESKGASLGRALLAKVGLHEPRPPQLVERPYLEENQQRQSEAIADELAISRELIRDNIVEGVDDVVVDTRLGLRTDSSVLPPLFRELHRRAEEAVGHEITFLKWMTDHATDEQLTNVWQWHDHYLSNLDKDPAFIEQISSVKTGYPEGSQKAIDAEALHPDMAVQEPRMEAISVVHGSPFSPVLAFAHASADRITSVIQVREQVSDLMLYHEVTHLLNGGLIFEFDEAATDLIAGTVYNHSNPEGEPFDPSNSVYANQIASLAAIERMTDGEVGLYELSRIYSGPDNSINTLSLANRIDEAIGLSVTIPLVEASRGIIEKGMGTHSGGVVRQAAQLLMRRQTEFLAAMMFDDAGNKVARTAQELATRMLFPDTLAKYGLNTVLDGLNILAEAHKLQGESGTGN